jgi:hypothetical protein
VHDREDPEVAPRRITHPASTEAGAAEEESS